jgi:hypothetical protein
VKFQPQCNRQLLGESAMRIYWRTSCVVALGFSLAACVIMPDVPPDLTFPMREILLNTACELQFKLRELSASKYKRFDPGGWLITVALSPKTDLEAIPSAGLTRKIPTRANAVRVTSWALNSPGVQLDAKTERSSGVGFAFKSSELINDSGLACDYENASYHALAHHLGVGAWLQRAVDAMYVTGSATIDKPTYNSDINIKFGANGSYTYTFLPGTDLAALSGSITVDEQLNITFAPLTTSKPFQVVTLPAGGSGFTANNARAGVSTTAVQAAQARTDVIQLEQAIRNLQVISP